MSKARELAALGNAYSDGSLSNRNLIINGAMQVAQRGTSFTAPDGAYTLDRYEFYQANGAVFDVKTSTDAPAGFGGSLEVDCTTADGSPASNAYAQMVQKIEGQNLQALAYGSSGAQKITLSFWVKSNKTGTYQVNFRLEDPTPDKMANKTYTINAADTWEYKSVTVDGYTVSAISNGNTTGLTLDWWYHSGSTYDSGSGSATYIDLVASNYNALATANLGDNTSNYLRMTGVQLEVGDTATPFEHRSYGQELALCQRYYRYIDCNNLGIGNAHTTNSWCYQALYFTPMRTTPSLSYSGSNSGTWWTTGTRYVSASANDYIRVVYQSSSAVTDVYVNGALDIYADAEL